MTPNPDFESRLAAEETLRLLAQVTPPESLTERVHARLHHQRALESALPRRRGFWSLWSPGQRFQFAGAAMLVLAVAGSMWTLNRGQRTSPSNLITPQLTAPTPQGTPFGGSKAQRVPATLNPIKVPPASKKKPSPKSVAKPSPKVLATHPTPAPNQ